MANGLDDSPRPTRFSLNTRWRKLGFLIRRGWWDLLARQSKARRGSVRWEDCGPVPLGEKRYTPQGLAWTGSRLIFANTWKNMRSRVYEYDPATMTLLRCFDMPDEAVHTSGLAWDGQRMWAVDYVSNCGYALNLEGSLATGRCQVTARFETHLKGTSACCLLPWDGATLLAISDYMNSGQTILVDHQAAAVDGTVNGHIKFAYRNEGFSQGLEYIHGHLYEAENKYGGDVINQMDPAKLKQTRDARRATIRQFPTPGTGVEDLAWDGKLLWTSDECSFRFFRGQLDGVPLEK